MSTTSNDRSLEDVKKSLSGILQEGGGPVFYKEWASNYEKDVALGEYLAPVKIAREFCGVVGDRKNIRIIDIGAGTGLVGEELAKYGFTNIDAVECIAEMLEHAKSKGVYRNIYCRAVSSSPTPGLNENSYDAAIAVGVLYPEAMEPDAVFEFLRLVKKGGLVVFGVNSKYGTPYAPEDFQSMFQQLERDGKAIVKLNKEVDRFLMGDKGMAYALQKL